MHIFWCYSLKWLPKSMFCDFYPMSGSILEYNLVLTISRYKPFLILHSIFDISTCDISSEAEQHGLHIKNIRHYTGLYAIVSVGAYSVSTSDLHSICCHFVLSL